MSILWLSDRASKLKKRRQNQNKCIRCGLIYFKTEDNCPNCSELTDDQVKGALSQRLNFRIGLGKSMFLASMVIIGLMFFI